jgi:hypothetical protein
MVSNATFNNISVISWRSVLLEGETGVHRENHRPALVMNAIRIGWVESPSCLYLDGQMPSSIQGIIDTYQKAFYN